MLLLLEKDWRSVFLALFDFGRIRNLCKQQRASKSRSFSNSSDYKIHTGQVSKAGKGWNVEKLSVVIIYTPDMSSPAGNRAFRHDHSRSAFNFTLTVQVFVLPDRTSKSVSVEHAVATGTTPDDLALRTMSTISIGGLRE